MKYLILILAILLLVTSTQAQKIITCEVVQVDKSVACPEDGKTILFTFSDANEAKKKFDEWRLVAPLQGESVNGDAPLGSRTIHSGDKVKAIIDQTHFEAVTECRVRVWYRIKDWQQNGLRQGERPPNGLQTLPDDCQPWYGKN